MKNFYTNKNLNIFANKANIVQLIALIVFMIYLCSITLAPTGDIIDSKKNSLFLNKNSKNNFYSSVLKSNLSAAAEITSITYVNNGQILARQIDNNNLQSYINGAKGSVLKLNNSNSTNVQNYSYDTYGNIINSPTLSLRRATQVQQNNLNEKLPHSPMRTHDSNSLLLHDDKISLLQTAQQQHLNLNDGNAINIPNSFQYNNERFDNNTNLQYLRARFYNPEIKRFINQDTYDLLNKFSYANNNPIMKSDPTGNNAWDDFADFFKKNLAISIPITIVIAGTLGALGALGIKKIVNYWRRIEQEKTVAEIKKTMEDAGQANELPPNTPPFSDSSAMAEPGLRARSPNLETMNNSTLNELEEILTENNNELKIETHTNEHKTDALARTPSANSMHNSPANSEVYEKFDSTCS